ncbi:lytic enzyme [Salmonella enterica]|nr:lytic enzyme [Salmonella enterica]EIN5575593.1 lytic enzyme [Salmonella enterica]
MKNIITIIVAIIIVFYAGMWSQKFLMEDECLDSGGSYNENGICNIAGSHQDVPHK